MRYSGSTSHRRLPGSRFSGLSSLSSVAGADPLLRNRATFGRLDRPACLRRRSGSPAHALGAPHLFRPGRIIDPRGCGRALWALRSRSTAGLGYCAWCRSRHGRRRLDLPEHHAVPGAERRRGHSKRPAFATLPGHGALGGGPGFPFTRRATSRTFMGRRLHGDRLTSYNRSQLCEPGRHLSRVTAHGPRGSGHGTSPHLPSPACRRSVVGFTVFSCRRDTLRRRCHLSWVRPTARCSLNLPRVSSSPGPGSRERPPARRDNPGQVIPAAARPRGVKRSGTVHEHEYAPRVFRASPNDVRRLNGAQPDQRRRPPSLHQETAPRPLTGTADQRRIRSRSSRAVWTRGHSVKARRRAGSGACAATRSRVSTATRAVQAASSSRAAAA